MFCARGHRHVAGIACPECRKRQIIDEAIARARVQPPRQEAKPRAPQVRTMWCFEQIQFTDKQRSVIRLLAGGATSQAEVRARTGMCARTCEYTFRRLAQHGLLQRERRRVFQLTATGLSLATVL